MTYQDHGSPGELKARGTEDALIAKAEQATKLIRADGVEVELTASSWLAWLDTCDLPPSGERDEAAMIIEALASTIRDLLATARVLEAQRNKWVDSTKALLERAMRCQPSPLQPPGFTT